MSLLWQHIRGQQQIWFRPQLLVIDRGTMDFSRNSSFRVVELRSPIFPFRYNGEEIEDPLSHIGRVINDNLDIFVNETYGFHVHISRGIKGFRFVTVKSLAMLGTVFERGESSSEE